MGKQSQPEYLLKLIKDAQNGDKDAFGVLYNEYYEPILRFMNLRVPSADDAEDLTQQVFIRFYRNLQNWEDRGFSPLAYIFTIARSVIADHWRRNKHRPVENSEDILLLIEDNTDGPARRIIEQEGVSNIINAIGNLPKNYQEVISLRLIKGLKNPEIAKIINKSEVATRKLYSRGIQKLRQELGSRELP